MSRVDIALSDDKRHLMLAFYDKKERLIGRLGQFDNKGPMKSYKIEGNEVFAGFDGFISIPDGTICSLRPVILRPQPNFIEDSISNMATKLAVISN